MRNERKHESQNSSCSYNAVAILWSTACNGPDFEQPLLCSYMFKPPAGAPTQTIMNNRETKKQDVPNKQ